MIALSCHENQRFFRLAVVGLVALFMTGCVSPAVMERKELSMPVLEMYGAFQHSGVSPEVRLVKLQLGRGGLTAEIASTPAQAAAGLAFRSALAPDSAMLFTYPTPRTVVFHMKNTYIPLSVAYIDSMGGILEMYDLDPGVEAPLISKANVVRFVLEVNRGWFEKNGVVTGSRIFIEQ